MFLFLPLIRNGTLQAVSQTNTTRFKMAPSVIEENPEFAEVFVDVPPGSLFNDDGTPGNLWGLNQYHQTAYPASSPSFFATTSQL